MVIYRYGNIIVNVQLHGLDGVHGKWWCVTLEVCDRKWRLHSVCQHLTSKLETFLFPSTFHSWLQSDCGATGIFRFKFYCIVLYCARLTTLFTGRASTRAQWSSRDLHTAAWVHPRPPEVRDPLRATMELPSRQERTRPSLAVA